ncbi:MAG: ABC transporter ATP-binding protein [Bradymonadia bacterium]
MTVRRNLLCPDVEKWTLDEPIIELINVSKSFDGKSVINDLSLTVTAGQSTVISGQSGTGKSVLLKLMNGLVLPDKGTVKLFGHNLMTVDERKRTELRKRCTMVFQNYALIDSMTVRDNVGFSLTQNTDLEAKIIDEHVIEILEMLELGHALDLMPASLSGGMKKRVALARAVITNPEIVLFDEPTTGLDPIMIEFVDGLIEKTQKAFGLTSVIVSHDMASNRRLADTIAILDQGHIVASGRFEDIQHHPHPAVKKLMSSAQTSRSLEDAPQRQNEPVPYQETQSIIEVTNVHKSFGKNEVLKGISCAIPKGLITVVIGGSGSGKSVLIKHMIGLLKPTKGTVTVFGNKLSELDSSGQQALQQRIGMLFQSAALFDSMTVEENIGFPLIEGQRWSRVQAAPEIKKVAEALKVDDLLHRLPDAISNGQRKRVALARALISKPDIVIYDEPTTGQDPVMMQNVDDMIVAANQAFDITSIVISHDMHSTFRIADYIIMIKEGHLVIAGSPDEVRTSTDKRVQAFVNAGQGSKQD